MDFEQKIKFQNYGINNNGNFSTKSSEKIAEFKKRLENFNNIKTIEEAKQLAKSILPVSQEINHINIEGAKCIVINKSDSFRISFNTPEEFICYDFV